METIITVILPLQLMPSKSRAWRSWVEEGREQYILAAINCVQSHKDFSFVIYNSWVVI